MLKHYRLWFLGIGVFASVLGWLIAGSRGPANDGAPVDAATRPARVVSSQEMPSPARVIDQRPPAARDGTPVVAEYGFVGAIGDEGGSTRYLFTRGDETFSVSLGGILDRTWRVQSVESDRVRLTRLADGAAGVIPYSSAGSGSLELPSDATAHPSTPHPVSRRSLHGRHP